MKTQIFTISLLIVSLVANAQSSRRNESDRSDHNRSNRNNSINQNDRGNNSRGHSENVRIDSHRGNTNNNAVVNRAENHRVGYPNRIERTPERREWNDNRETYRHDSYRDNRVGSYSRSSFRRPYDDRHYNRHIEPLEVRRVRYPFVTPFRVNICWTSSMWNSYRTYYPEVSYWRYPIGYRIACISAYDSRAYINEVATVYGRVNETYYNVESDEYYLYIGETYPYQDFTIVVPGYQARNLSRIPENYFTNSNIKVTGYVSNIEGKPEIQVRSMSQIDVY
jgi:hypothetical protein